MKQLTEISRGYSSFSARLKAIHALARAGFNYFVPYRDVHAEFALQYGVADWVRPGSVHVDEGYPAWNGSRRKSPRCTRPWVATE